MDAQTRVEHTLGAGRADPGDGQGAGRALRGGQAARATTRARCSTRTSGWPRATASTASSSTCPSAERVPRQGAGAAPARPPARARPGPRLGGRARRDRRTCSSAATAPRASSWSTRPTTTCARSWRRSWRRDRGVDADPYATVGGSTVPMASGRPLRRLQDCGSEVSPYITECPYCGTRLRKRAPKIERGGDAEAPPRQARSRAARCGRAAAGEIPGIRADARGPTRRSLLVLRVAARARSRRRRAAATSATSCSSPASTTSGGARSRRSFVYVNDRLRARRARGDRPLRLAARAPPRAAGAVLVFLARAASAGMRRDRRPAPRRSPCGGNGAALGAAGAWAMPDLLGRRARRGHDGDLLGVAVIAAVLVLLPLATPRRSAVAGRGGVVGVSSGWCLARLARVSRTADRPRLGPSTSRPIGHAVDLVGASGDGGEQAARGHRVAHQPAARLGHAVGERREGRPRRRGCAASRRRARARRQQLEHAVDRRDRAGVDLGGQPLAAPARAAWPSRPKPVTSVSACAPAAARPARRRASFSVVITAIASRDQLVGGQAALERRRDRAGAERLGQHERVAGPAARVGQHRVAGATMPGDRQAVLRLGVVDRVAADDRRRRPPPRRRRRRAGSRAARPARASRAGRRRGSAPMTGAAAHRVDVRQRVGRGDPAERVGVVDDRREEVDGLHERQVVGQLRRRPRRRRCRPRRARAGRSGAAAGDDRAQVGGGELAAAARAVGEGGEGRRPSRSYDGRAVARRRAYTDAEVDAAVAGAHRPGAARGRPSASSSRARPQLQRDPQPGARRGRAGSAPRTSSRCSRRPARRTPSERLRAVRTLLAEETRVEHADRRRGRATSWPTSSNDNEETD